ncbi:alpha/beta hydrolase [Propionimicrobium sp. PCR01-08-3]|uniref:alpha/beta fold hydrolase n=1 Tax=Propionimicrobium sp. PCR01-08-3 TaxID=3052086 RepID=UPI00255CFC63|nr:alpha/beta hydrolase [Propionimicrobium sp. PCR01-08-3]WIY82614.1 alpha/beta hydrolase [Propionimicrobium sp. PCR01-08-3]
MPMLTTTKAHPTELYYRDSKGPGRPIVLVHGWPASEASWNQITPVLQEAGYRVIAYDRRGFGRSGKPGSGYDYDTFASDLDELLIKLDLSDAVLVGFSMGGGEVARYIGKYGTGRVTAACFIGAITPCNDATLPDNPDGAFTPDAAAEMQSGLLADPVGFLKGFLTNFYSVPADGDQTRLMVPAAEIDHSIMIAQQGNVNALACCIPLWLTDFRQDLAKFTVPALVIHGQGDQIVPFAASGARMPQYLDDVTVKPIPDGPHGLLASHPDVVARELLAFLG